MEISFSRNHEPFYCGSLIESRSSACANDYKKIVVAQLAAVVVMNKRKDKNRKRLLSFKLSLVTAFTHTIFPLLLILIEIHLKLLKKRF